MSLDPAGRGEVPRGGGRPAGLSRHAGPAAHRALLLGRRPPAAAAAMAAAKGALEEGAAGSAEAGAEPGEDGDGCAELSGAGGYRKRRFSPPPLGRPRMGEPPPPRDGSLSWPLPLSVAPGPAVVYPSLRTGRRCLPAGLLSQSRPGCETAPRFLIRSYGDLGLFVFPA